jgi:hypothetical protein
MESRRFVQGLLFAMLLHSTSARFPWLVILPLVISHIPDRFLSRQERMYALKVRPQHTGATVASADSVWHSRELQTCDNNRHALRRRLARNI